MGTAKAKGKPIQARTVMGVQDECPPLQGHSRSASSNNKDTDDDDDNDDKKKKNHYAFPVALYILSCKLLKLLIHHFWL